MAAKRCGIVHPSIDIARGQAPRGRSIFEYETVRRPFRPGHHRLPQEDRDHPSVVTPIRFGDWTFDHGTYDRDADAMYLSIGEPVSGTGEESSEGHILRFDEDGRFVGITLIDVSDLIEAGAPAVITLPQPAEIPAEDLELVVG